MNTLDDILVGVQAQKAGPDSLSSLIGGLRQRVAVALSGVKLPVGVQERVDKIFSEVEQNKDAVNLALTTEPVTGNNEPDAPAGEMFRRPLGNNPADRRLTTDPDPTRSTQGPAASRPSDHLVRRDDPIA